MLRQHGMLRLAHLDMNGAPLDGIDGDMLFHRSVGGAGDQLVHLLAAADHGHTRVLHHGDEVSAMLTNKKSLFHGGLLSSSVDFSPAPAWARHRFSLSARC